MNFGTILMLLVVVVAAVMGLFFILGNTATHPYVDSAGNTTSNVTNSSQAVVTNLTSTSGTVGTGLVFIVIFIFAIGILGTLVVVALRNI